MKFFENFDWSFKSIAKIIGLLLLGVISFSIIIALFSFSFKSLFNFGGNNYYPEAATQMAEFNNVYDGRSLSENVQQMRTGLTIPTQIKDEFIKDDDSENFEIKEYFTSIRTRKLKENCETISKLKERDYVIFSSSEQSDKSCDFKLKVKKGNEDEIINVIKEFKPEIFNTKIETIKKIVEDYDSELDILKKKLISIEETLKNAQDAYDEITVLATKKQDVENLAKIIESKLNLIEKLSKERIDIKEQIDRFSKEKSEQLARINYSYFNINIYEDLLIDIKQIKDSWQYEIKSFVRNINGLIQDVSIHLATYTLRFVQAAIYFFISVLLVKLGWRITKKIWGKK